MVGIHTLCPSHSAYDLQRCRVLGFNACVLTYGQTGSGKTYTVFGPEGILEESLVSNHRTPSSAGVVLRAISDIIDAVPVLLNTTGIRLTLSAQYVQLYNEELTDLVTGKKVALRGAGAAGEFVLQNCVNTNITTLDEALTLLREGEARKRFAATAMNEHSSRAHTVFVLKLTQARQDTLVESQLSLVDLAGCEQLKQSGATGLRKAEAIGINWSLTVLKKVISALVQGKTHVPYMESKLTMLLKGPLGGGSRTTAIVTGAMDDFCASQTLNALRFGADCAQITNTVSAGLGDLTVEGALAQVEAAIGQAEATLHSLHSRGKSHLPAYKKTANLVTSLKRRREELVSVRA